MALHLRKSETPVPEAMKLIAEKVLPHFALTDCEHQKSTELI
jgi:hypothetical protein